MIEKKADAHDPGAEKQQWKKMLMLGLALIALFGSAFGASYAVYRSSAHVEVGTAGVAAYAVSAGSSTGGNLTIDCNTLENHAEFNFWVDNSDEDGKTAEVAVKYSVEVVTSTELPESLEMKLDGISGTANGNVYTFESDEWMFAAGVDGDAREHTLQFTADVTDIESDLNISDIVITVITEQIN